jgi:imidazolonepropionase-like amidohydrolase
VRRVILLLKKRTNYECWCPLWLKAKIHVNQFNSIGGIQAGVKHKALSVDHLEIMTPEDIEALKNMETMPVAYLLALIS